MLNLVCRDEELKRSVIKKFFTLFEVVFSISIPASVNKVLVCLVQNSPAVKDCFLSVAINKKPGNLTASMAEEKSKKTAICDGKCETLVSDMCQRLISESKQAYVKDELLEHLSHITVHQLESNYSTV